jgi:hypothetical protein
MKRSVLSALLAGILIVSGGCDNEPTTPTREGTLLGTLDGAAWVGTAQSDVLSDTIEIYSQRRNVAAEHWLTVRAVETSPGVFAVVTAAMSANPSRYAETVGGDVLVYRAEVTAGTISFQQLDLTRGVMRGTLSLTIQGARGTSRLEEGTFEAHSWRGPNER